MAAFARRGVSACLDALALLMFADATIRATTYGGDRVLTTAVFNGEARTAGAADSGCDAPCALSRGTLRRLFVPENTLSVPVEAGRQGLPSAPGYSPL